MNYNTPIDTSRHREVTFDRYGRVPVVEAAHQTERDRQAMVREGHRTGRRVVYRGDVAVFEDEIDTPIDNATTAPVLRQAFNPFETMAQGDMTPLEHAQSIAGALASLTAQAAAQVAAEQIAEQARGQEPPVGATVRFSKTFGGSKQYNYSAIRVERPGQRRVWHHTGGINVSSSLANPCTWEQINDFANEGTVEVGVRWTSAHGLAEAVNAEAEPVRHVSDHGITQNEIDLEQQNTLLAASLRNARALLHDLAEKPGRLSKKSVSEVAVMVRENLSQYDQFVSQAAEKQRKADEQANHS